MKSILRILLLLLAAVPAARAQTFIDTTSGRYYRPIFPNVTVTSNVTYGSATTYTGSTQTLVMDVYQPTGDVLPRRPLIIFAHQGGFLTGSKTDAYMVNVCTQFARLGYVTASIEYRLGFPITGFPPPAADTVGVAQAAIRGMQDLRAAVRFFRKDAATTNTYRIQPSYIAVGGSSAGAFMALSVGYIDKATEVPTYVGLAGLGGIEGNSGNPGYSSAVLAVLNLSGATEQPSVIEAGNAPLLSVHGTSDGTVPYLQGRVGSLLPPKYVYGSGRLNPRATQVGVRNTLVRLSRAGHIPFESNTAYADTTFRAIRDFLRPALAQAGTTLAARTGASAQPTAHAYPNPANDAIRLQLPEAWVNLAEAQLLDAAGRVVRTLDPTSTRDLTVLRGSLKAGLYLLKVPGQVPVRIEFK
ncbi:alpha/beta hydrolase fold domain-containing protein [Hymenobacter properus]|uniref:Alpha/beta hydrolase fold domain-containing protein n=1 Tax=Hymenobacter properus TaxID=2791026 RepID=A0A931BFX5_9BACT|nr:alpha/beta hydrolase fold domain-containing protein [Hymenobacter properus]MBF9143184.1 alpha/beta hydrolase fold domain-containing protein [Hymenobacter properus]MBR7721992.1 alpha/beta hydrolase fold domain-containing protein [Microvirga sp. SRT04]